MQLATKYYKDAGGTYEGKEVQRQQALEVEQRGLADQRGVREEKEMTEEDFAELLARVREMRNAMLFEEPCPLFEEEELHG